MRVLTSRTEVLRYTKRYAFGGEQRLVRRWYLFGLRIWTTVLDTEEVPAWAEIQLAALGSTEWESKFKEYMG